MHAKREAGGFYTFQATKDYPNCTGEGGGERSGEGGGGGSGGFWEVGRPASRRGFVPPSAHV